MNYLKCIKKEIWKILSRIKGVVIKCQIAKKYHCTFGKRVETYNCTYEGYNYVSDNSVVIDSQFGFGTYLAQHCAIERSYIGRYCSIASDVGIGYGSHPSSVWVTTYPAFYMNTTPYIGFSLHKKDEKYQAYKKAFGKYHCKIGNDVWIGRGVTIVSGVTIGDGAIIGANSLVLKDVAPYEIVGGLPAKHIRFRFTPEQIAALQRIEWWNNDFAWVQEHYNDFENIDSFIAKYAGVKVDKE